MRSLANFVINAQGTDIYESFNSGQYSGYASLMNKVALYNRREMAALGHGINESFRSRHGYNQDILFTDEEQQAAEAILLECLAHLTTSMNEELLQVENMINEGWRDNIGKFCNSVKSVAGKIGSTIQNAKEYISKQIKDTKDQIEQKYQTAIEFIKSVIAKGVSSVRDFITAIAKLFEKLGNGIKDALSKLGAFKKEKDEESGDIKVDDKVFDDVSNDEEKSFLSHVMSYIAVMTGEHKDRAEKLMTEDLLGGNLNSWTFEFNDDEILINESAIMDKIANNKFIQFILCYGKGKKISIWKSILISIAGSLIISLALPVALALAGAGAATIPVIVAAVRFVWSTRGAFKIILNRYVNKSPGEKLFDTKTIILIAICILPQIPPFKDWIAQLFKKFLEWTHLDKAIEKFEQILGKLIEKLHGKNPSEVVKTDVIEKTIEGEGGGRIIGPNPEATRNAVMNNISANPGMDADHVAAAKELMYSGKDAKTSMSTLKAFKDKILELGDRICKGIYIDCRIPGINPHKIEEIMQDVCKKYAGAIQTVDQSDIVYANSGGMYGSTPMALNLPDEAVAEIRERIIKELGVSPNDIIIQEFGKGYFPPVEKIARVVVEPVHWLFDTLVASFSPTFIPFLDKAKFRLYEMSFGSNAKKHKYYTVARVEKMSLSDAESAIGEGKGEAYNKFIEYIKSIQEYHKELYTQAKEMEKSKDKSVKEKIFGLFKKDQSKNFEKNGKFDKRTVLLFYVEVLDENKKKKEMPGVMVDMLSMMCVDVCSFRKQRKNPYFLKGLLSKLSFRPTNPNDNDTKQFIRTTLGTTLATACKQNVSYSIGSMFVKKENKKWVPGSDTDKDKVFVNLGNFSPSQLCEVLNDTGSDNKVAYQFIGGEYGSRWNMSMKDGKLKKNAKDMDKRNRSGKAASDSRTIENKTSYCTVNDMLIEELTGERVSDRITPLYEYLLARKCQMA